MERREYDLRRRFSAGSRAESTVSRCASATATVLLPGRYREDFRRISIFYYGGYTSRMFEYMLQRGRHLLYAGVLPRYDSPRTHYQVAGQQPIRLSFRPDDRQWVEFSELARFHNMSRCALFTLLFELLMSGFLDQTFDDSLTELERRDQFYPGRMEFRHVLHASGRWTRTLSFSPLPYRRMSEADRLGLRYYKRYSPSPPVRTLTAL